MVLTLPTRVALTDVLPAGRKAEGSEERYRY